MATSIPWWQKHEGSKDLDYLRFPPSSFDSSCPVGRLLRFNGLDLMSPMSRSHLKARFKLMAGREFQAGRRRIKDRVGQSPYSFTSFLQDRQLSGSTLMPSYCSCTVTTSCSSSICWHQAQCLGAAPCSSTDGGGGKRHRLMPNSDHVVDASTEFPALDTTIGTTLQLSTDCCASHGTASDALLTFPPPTVVEMSRTGRCKTRSNVRSLTAAHKF
jgi:hypothetical protein